MNKEQIEEIFELGAQAQYECWNPQGEGDVGKFTKLKDKAVKLFSIHCVTHSTFTVDEVTKELEDMGHPKIAERFFDKYCG